MADAGIGDMLPEGAVDVTAEVNELKDKLHEVIKGGDINVVAMAIGSIIAESFDDVETIKYVLHTLASAAACIVEATQSAPEGVTIN